MFNLFKTPRMVISLLNSLKFIIFNNMFYVFMFATSCYIYVTYISLPTFSFTQTLFEVHQIPHQYHHHSSLHYHYYHYFHYYHHHHTYINYHHHHYLCVFLALSHQDHHYPSQYLYFSDQKQHEIFQHVYLNFFNQ